MTLTVTAGALDTLRALLARDPARPAMCLMFAGGCGALGYRLTPASGPMAGDALEAIGGITFYVDYKSRLDLDGAVIDVGDTAPDDLGVLHDRVTVGGLC